MDLLSILQSFYLNYASHCERSLATRVKLCGTSEALDRQSVLKEIWKSNVFRLYTKKGGVIALHSDKRIYEVINGIEADVELFESMADKSSQKLAKPQQRERDKSQLLSPWKRKRKNLLSRSMGIAEP